MVPGTLALGRAMADPSSQALALVSAALLYVLRRDGARAAEYSDAVARSADEHGLAQFKAFALLLGGWARTMQGDRETGIGQMRAGLAFYQNPDSVGGIGVWSPSRPRFLALIGEALGQVGRAGEGLRVLAEARAAPVTGASHHLSEIQRLTGELLLRTAADSLAGSPPGPSLDAEAEHWFRQALETARRQRAKSFELRAAMSLSRLLRKQGRKEEARALLGETYAWFTEGHDTLDLQEARALLEALA
jgi:predicted ATPase